METQAKEAAPFILDELHTRIDEMFGLFFDARLAMQNSADKYEVEQKAAALQLGLSTTPEALDKTPLWFGNGDPNETSSVVTHQVTSGEFLRRNRFNGRNHAAISQAVISFLYSIWEDEFRNKIGLSVGRDKNEIVSDVFGDIRLIRNSIIHHRNIAKK